MEKLFKQKNSGITLVALVITIIILLILAGISISSLTGSGLFKKADDAAKASDRANVKEQLQIAVMTSRMNANGSIDKEELRKELEELKKNGTIDSYEAGAGDTNIIFTATKGKNEYEIDEDGNVELKGATIVVSGLTVKNGDTVLAENSKEVAVGQALKVSFKAEIEGGTITSVKVKGTAITHNNGSVEFTTDGNTSVTFEIEGKAEDGTIVKREYTVNLKGYYNIPEMKVGDYVNYTPDPLTIDSTTGKNAKLEELNSAINAYSGYYDENDATNTTQSLTQTVGLKWRILELDETGTKPKTLISANETNESLILNGADGYNNAVYLINEACKTLYSRAGVGEARSITIEDLEKHYSQDGINARNTYNNGEPEGYRYGDTKRYEGSNVQYPKIAEEENSMGIDTTPLDANNKNPLKTDGLNRSEQDKIYTGSDQAKAEKTNGITIKRTSYILKSNLSSMYDSTNPYYDLIHGSISNLYWLASRSVVNYSNNYNNCRFAVFVAGVIYGEDFISASYLFEIDGDPNASEYRLRPLVSVESNIEAEYEGAVDSTYNTWNLI